MRPSQRTTTVSWRISTTRVRKRAAIDPSLIRFSMSGRTQYLIDSPIASPRCTSVTAAPARNSSSAASAAEFLPPTTTTDLR